jgi:hypothetical protein
VSALALDKLLGNLHHGRIRFGIRQSIKDRSCVVDVALLVEGLSDQTALGRAQGDGAFSLGDHHPRQGDTTRFLNRPTRLSQLVTANPLELAVFWGVASQGRHHGLGCHCDAGTPSEVILGGGWSGKLILSR